MTTRLMGVETEYAIKGLDEQGAAVDSDPVLREVFRIAGQRLTNLENARAAGLYLGNGARFYNDQGHPEYSTPECDNPWDVVRYVLAGDRSLLAISREIVRLDGVQEVPVYKGNVDYSGAETTWGCHESHQYSAHHGKMPGQIIPHLVSRILYTGAGGFNPLAPGLEFLVSPRVVHLRQAVSGNSTDQRGIYHHKNESLSTDRFARLHLLCGESNCSHLASLLKVGVTALVVALIDAGHEPGTAVELVQPLGTMRRFARDANCRVTAKLKHGERLSALGIQRHYLEQVTALLGDPCLPDWAPEICGLWREVLDQFEQDPSRLDVRLDWRIKRTLFDNYLAGRGYSWREINSWNRLVKKTTRSRAAVDREFLRQFLDESRSKAEEPETKTPPLQDLLREARLSEERYHDFLALRGELFELDFKFAQLGPRGLFNALDGEGVLRHRAERVDRIEEAVDEPPPRGRAHVRGTTIREMAAQNFHADVSWTHIRDHDRRRALNLTDPFVTSAEWVPMATFDAEEHPLRRRRSGFVRLLLDRGL